MYSIKPHLVSKADKHKGPKVESREIELVSNDIVPSKHRNERGDNKGNNQPADDVTNVFVHIKTFLVFRTFPCPCYGFIIPCFSGLVNTFFEIEINFFLSLS